MDSEVAKAIVDCIVRGWHVSDQHFLDSHIEDKRWLDGKWWAKPTLPGFLLRRSSASCLVELEREIAKVEGLLGEVRHRAVRFP